MRAELEEPVPKSPDSLLAIFSNDRPSEEQLEELGADDILEEEAEVIEAKDADATLPPADAPRASVPPPVPTKVEAKVEAPKAEEAPKSEPPKSAEVKPLVAPIAAPVIVEAPLPSDPEMAEPTIVLERKSMAEAEKRSEPVADRTMRMVRTDAMQAASILASVPPAPNTAPVLGANSTQRVPAQRPQSIAPVALDVGTVPPPAFAKSSQTMGIALAAAGLVLLVGSVTAGVVLARRPAATVASASTSTTATAQTTAEPKTPSVEAAGTAEINANPSTASAKDSAHPSEPSELPSADVASLPSAPPPAAKLAAPSHAQAERPAAPAAEKPSHVQAEKPAAPAAEKPAPVAAAKPAAGGVAPTSGVIRVPVSDSIITIKVDGSHRRVKNGAVAVGCGHHTVQVGTSVMKEVDVPCGGAVFVE